MNILSIQSHVAYGHVGNAAAVFPLQRLGFEIWPVHTVQFSNHPGYGAWKGEVFGAGHVRQVIDGLAERGVLDRCAAVLSGYLGDAGVGDAVLAAAARVKQANPRALYLCDPVMGDAGSGLFVRTDIPTLLRDRAVPAADIVTPNVFELARLTGREVDTLDAAVVAARDLLGRGPEAAVVTSLRLAETPADSIDMLAVTADGAWRVRTPYLAFETAPNGAGDFVAALFLAHYLTSRAAAAALADTAAAVYAVLAATKAAGERELQLIAAQDEIVAPKRRFAAERLDV